MDRQAFLLGYQIGRRIRLWNGGYIPQPPPGMLMVRWLDWDGSVLDSAVYQEGQTEPTTQKAPIVQPETGRIRVATGWDSGTIDGRVKTYNPVGWSAIEECMVYSAGTVLATADHSSRTPYTKTNNEWAAALIAENTNDSEYGGNWCHVLLVSMARNSVVFSVPNTGEAIITGTYKQQTFFVGRSGQNSNWGGATTLITTLPKLDFNGENLVRSINNNAITENAFLKIMQALGVEVHPKSE